MYSTDLTSISLDAFEETILTIDLLPSRMMLAEEITDVVPELKRMGIDNLEDLRGLLRDKARYAELAASLSVDEKYLIVLSREVNSYVSKPVSLPTRRLRRAGTRTSAHGPDPVDQGAL
jgi:hypothetical protein